MPTISASRVASPTSDERVRTPHASMASELAGLVVANAALRAREAQWQELLARQQQSIEALRQFLTTVARAMEASPSVSLPDPQRARSRRQLATLTSRQQEVLALVLAGHSNKAISATLGISQRTVETHRAAIMSKTGSTSVPALTRLALLAGGAA
jgi:FixJ family two-component response regulator